MINRKTAPAITDAVSFNLSLKPCERYVLDNKTPVYAIHAGAQDVVMVEWVFYAGNWYESKNNSSRNYQLFN